MSSQDITRSNAPMFSGTVSDTRLIATMPLLYRPNRLIYFLDQVRCLAEYDAQFVDLRIVTNTFDSCHKEVVMNLLRPFESARFRITIQSFWNDNDPKQMTWVHKKMITDEFLGSSEFTHFIYLEDDIRLSRQNMGYFIETRPILRPSGFIPGFVRYEFNFSSLRLYTSDIVRSADIAGQTLCVEGGTFVMANNPYCATYILDQELAEEYVRTDSFDPERSAASCRWPSTERSAMGLCFENVPPGHHSRFKIPVDIGKNIPGIGCLIHHLPNNFTNRDWPEGHTPFGKTELLKVFS